MLFQKGQKSRLADLGLGDKLLVDCQLDADVTLDLSCFGVDEHDRLSDERYMVFYNQRSSPNAEVRLLQDGSAGAQFELNLAMLPASIAKLVFTAAIDGAGTLRALRSLAFQVGGAHTFRLTAEDFAQEKAIIIAEIYRKAGAWRIGAVGQGFDGGLEALLTHFGGAATHDTGHDPSAASHAPAPSPLPYPSPPAEKPAAAVSLVKRFEERAPALVSLAKKAAVSLEKNKLSHVRAKVALVLDASGSMWDQYRNGQVQEAVNRVFPLAVHFDDNEALDVWAFAQLAKKLNDIGFDNHSRYVDQEQSGWKTWMSQLNGAHNNEPVVIRSVIQAFTGLTPPEFTPPEFKKKGGFLGFGGKLPVHASPIGPVMPIFVIFISDGGIYEDGHIDYLLRWSSTLPIFWQFVGIGGASYGVLKRLDHLSGRCIDNANFFAIDDLNQISEEELYDRLTNEFPLWLQLAREKNIIL